ncbi:MAG: cytidylate kinase-like family protein [Spirochaetales bacterium]|jgi:cytidylate kinase|nr:cytidylate kinase-like family protein [Spirochaetales bacterium]
MQKTIITISREFGSGGKTIGRMAAEKLNFAYYDKELIRQVAEETGLHEKFVEQEGEYASGKSLLSFVLSAWDPNGSLMGPGMSLDDYLWASQKKVILSLADKGPCVIVGRCAEYILRDRRDCLDVFIHAPLPARVERVSRYLREHPPREGSGFSGETQPEKILEERDQRRRVYYKYFTGREWGMAQNYHLCLDSAEVGPEKCVDIIINLARS